MARAFSFGPGRDASGVSEVELVRDGRIDAYESDSRLAIPNQSDMLIRPITFVS